MAGGVTLLRLTGPWVFFRDSPSAGEARADRVALGERAAVALLPYLDDDDLPRFLVEFLRKLLVFEAAIVFVNRRDYPPLHLHDTMKTALAKKGVTNYARSTYLLNPFYNAFLRGIKRGIYRMGEVAPAAPVKNAHYRNQHIRVTALEEIGYLTKDWPPGRAEVLVAMELPDGEMGEISLIHPTRQGGFSEADLQTWNDALPFLETCFARFWRRAPPEGTRSGPGRSPSRRRRSAAARVERSGTRSGVSLILKGHSTPSISLQPGISATTIKTHRKNLYAKLGIATHYELSRCSWSPSTIQAARRLTARSGRWDRPHPPLVGWDRQANPTDTSISYTGSVAGIGERKR